MKVQLTYFKESGKYYSEGEYETSKACLYDIWDEISDMLIKGIRPGLVNGHSGYHVLIDVPGHKHEHPKMLMGAG